MSKRKSSSLQFMTWMAILGIACVVPARAGKGQEPAASTAPLVRQLGSIKTIQGNAITLATDAGAEFNVTVQDSTRMVRTAPGQKDLKGASAIQLQDLKVGDRILVRGKNSEDGKTLVAASIIAMMRSDIEQKQAHEREDWQKRGVGGLVKTVDAASNTITITTGSFGAAKSVAVHLSKDCVLRRYAPNSVKFDDAKPGTLDEIKPGDQLRGRGTRSPDGAEIAAEEIVTGSFRNIAGTVASVDAAANALSVNDLITKKPVLVKFTADSQLRKLPSMMAEMMAMRLKGGAPGAGAGPGGASGGPGGPGGGAPSGPPGGQGGWSRPGGGSRPGGPPDFQQMLSRLPAAALADLQKGEAVMIVSTQGTGSGEVTAITLLGGVEPILRASPESQQMILSPWSLGGGGGGEGGAQ